MKFLEKGKLMRKLLNLIFTVTGHQNFTSVQNSIPYCPTKIQETLAKTGVFEVVFTCLGHQDMAQWVLTSCLIFSGSPNVS